MKLQSAQTYTEDSSASSLFDYLKGKDPKMRVGEFAPYFYMNSSWPAIGAQSVPDE